MTSWAELPESGLRVEASRHFFPLPKKKTTQLWTKKKNNTEKLKTQKRFYPAIWNYGIFRFWSPTPAPPSAESRESRGEQRRASRSRQCAADVRPKFPRAVRSAGDVAAAAAALPPLYKPTPTEQLTAQANKTEAGGREEGGGVYLMTQHAFVRALVRAWNGPQIRGKYAENLVLWKVKWSLRVFELHRQLVFEKRRRRSSLDFFILWL